MQTLKALRERAGLKQTDLAEKLHTTKQTLYKWERGIAPVAPRHWRHYAEVLGVPMEQFEEVLIETLKAYAIETLNPDGLGAAMRSGRYNTEKIFAASQQLVKAINAPAPDDGTSNVRKPSTEGTFVPIITSAAAATCNPGLMPLLDCVNQYSEETAFFQQGREGDFAIEVTGSSMSPWYPDGTLLLVRPYQDLRTGQRVVVVLDNGEIIFKIYAEKGDKICLFSIDGDGKDFVFTKPQVPIRYICRVIASIRNEDDLDAEMRQHNITHDWERKLQEVQA